ncbi:unnamed protein product [Dovyalis caffra]|uniref:Disease resistance protein n=1 Tax=Dovyalis caffra TaxID=77055 RepID=A0AAV1RQY5_9ROSI|nr:unnamed protein product [Dovyalis caffra]
MAESFATDIAKSLLGKLGSFTVQEFFLAWGLEGDLARLKKKLSAIDAVLSDAEKRQSHNDKIRLWLQELKEVLLAEIASLKSDFNLIEQTIDHSHVLHEETEMRQSFESFSGLIGRDKDKERIINLLVKPFKVGDEHPFVVPIVGMGGLGKTALAKSVALPNFPNKLDRVRTLLFASDLEEPRCKTDFEKCLTEFKHLRSLELLDDCEMLSERIGALKHLRYLHLSKNSKLKRLPKSLFKLQNLQALFLGDGLEELPKDVRYMISLRLLLLNTKQKRVPEGGIGFLECLQVLFIGECENLEYLCEDMQGLKSLRRLVIGQCNSLISLPRSMKYLTALEILTIFCCEKLDLGISMEEEYEEEIKPLRLQTVMFVWLPATLALPEQILQRSTDSLQTFMIGDCPNIREMPECVGNLKKLQVLQISGCPSLGKRGRFNRTASASPEQKSKPLSCGFLLMVVRDLQSVRSNKDEECALEINFLSLCALLTVPVGDSFGFSLFVAALVSCSTLPKPANKLDRVRSVLFASDLEEPRCKTDFEKCLTEFKHLRSLELLDDCELLSERIGVLKHLRYLNLAASSKLKRLPKSIFKLQNLQALFLGGQLEKLSKDVRYLISLRILLLSTKQKRLPEGGIGLLEYLQIFFIGGCENLEYLCEDMQGLKSLRRLYIVHCKSLISLPRSMKYLTALEILSISDCEKLDLGISMEQEYEEEIQPLRLQIVIFGGLPATQALPEQILQRSTDSLQTFIIGDCPNIRELPECVGNLMKLQALKIWGCPSLGKRCQMGTGEDCPKIAHIPDIDVDDDEESSY